MYQRDYLLRMIEQFTVTLGAMMNMRLKKEPEQQLLTIDELLKRLFRLDSKLLNRLSEQDLITMFTTAGKPDYDKLMLVARLLKEEADVYAAEPDEEEAYYRYLKSLQLMLYVRAANELDPLTAVYLTIDENVGRLQGFFLPDSVLLGLADYYEREARFDLAENYIFRLLEQDPADPLHHQAAYSFYERMNGHSDETLAINKLPRNEIVLGLAEVQSMNALAGAYK